MLESPQVCSAFTGQHLGKYGKLGQREGYMEEPGVKQGFDKEMKRSLPGKESGQQM